MTRDNCFVLPGPTAHLSRDHSTRFRSDFALGDTRENCSADYAGVAYPFGPLTESALHAPASAFPIFHFLSGLFPSFQFFSILEVSDDQILAS